MAKGELFDKKVLAGFAGLNAQSEPDTIKDEQASDILNFRHARTGYMESRNGTRALELKIDLDPDYLDDHFEGATSIGEYVLKTPVADDDGMLFAPGITGVSGELVLELTSNNSPFPMKEHDRYIFLGMRDGGHSKLAYVMFPLTQMPETRATWDHSWTLSDTSGTLAPTPADPNATTAIWFVSPEKADGDPTDRELLQPQRSMERWVDGSGNDIKWVNPATGAVRREATHWIEQYQQLNQFQDALIIADRINGDMALHDEYDEAEPGQTPVHRLRLAENCKAEFNIDAVNIDYQLGSGEKNDRTRSVMHGMALYKFYLQKSQAAGFVDHYHSNMVEYIGKDVEPEKVEYSNGAGDYWSYKYEDKVNKLLNNSGCFMKGFTAWMTQDERTSNGDDYNELGGVLKCIKTQRNRYYTYSNLVQDTEYSDLLRRASLTNPDLPKVYDKDGHAINQNATDVFIWEDMRIGYRVCSGRVHGYNLLRDLDRDWGKTVPTLPKTVTLKTHANIEQQVELGVYGYVYVFDYGNNDYSAPSSVLMAGDLLWSALDDEMLQTAKNYTGDFSGDKYNRESYYEGNGTERAAGSGGSKFPIFNVVDTAYRGLFTDIKNKLYTTGMKLADAAPNDEDKAPLITVFHEKDEIRLNGVLMEGIGMNIHINKADKDVDEIVDSKWVAVSLNQLVVPLTKIATKYTTLNSIFSDLDDASPYGFYRKALSPGAACYEIVLPEYGFPIGHPLSLHDKEVEKVFNETGAELDKTLLPNAWTYAVTALCDKSQKLVWGAYPDASEEIDVGNLNANDYFGRDIDCIRYKYDLVFNLLRTYGSDHNNTAAPMGSTVLRFTSKQDERFLNTAFDTPTEVIDRILCQGIAGLDFASHGDLGALRSEKYNDPNTANNAENEDLANKKCLDPDVHREWTNDTKGRVLRAIPDVSDEKERAGAKGHIMTIDEYTKARVVVADQSSDTTYIGQRYVKYVGHPQTIPDPDTSTVQDPHTESNLHANLRVVAYLPGERLMIPEQLSAYFPSSILFGAPRVMHTIKSEDVPRRAKRLLVFRTMASHSNAWQPTEFGLVSTVEIKRDGAGVAEDVKFFDDIKDSDIDFATNPDDFDGITKPLRSRFAVPWAKKMVYMNYIEHYQPKAPRGFNEQTQTSLSEIAPNYPAKTHEWNATWQVFKDDNNNDIGTLLTGHEVRYFVVFKDAIGVYSPIKMTEAINLSAVTEKCAVALKMSGYPYTGAVDKFEVYRCIGVVNPSTNPYKKIGEVKAEDEGVFVDYGKEAGTESWKVYNDTTGLPESAERIDVNESGIALSLANSPSWIKGTDREFLRMGDGDQITGGDVIYGDLVVFKESSVHRITPRDVQGTIGRIEEVANQWGCIAPNTIIAHNSEVYFLSWNGLMKYNNNVFESLDGDFGYELGLRLKDEYMGELNPGIRDASIAINPIYSELYLNIPVYDGDPAYDYHQKGLKGHIYVINLANNFATKFAYETGDREIFYPGGEENPKTLGTWEATLGRIYHKTTKGQLFSADILPKQVGLRSFVHIEAPTDREYDEYQPAIKADGSPETTNKIATSYVHSWWRSKLFYEYSKTIIKKVRNAFTYFSRGRNIRIGAEFLNNEYVPSTINEAQFGVTGELQYVMPRRSPGNDRGERVYFHLASEGSSEVQAFEFYWREVNKFAR